MMENTNKFISPGVPTREGAEMYVNPKSLAIDFAIWVSNQQVLDDFWSMSKEAQEDAYDNFLKERN